MSVHSFFGWILIVVGSTLAFVSGGCAILAVESGNELFYVIAILIGIFLVPAGLYIFHVGTRAVRENKSTSSIIDLLANLFNSISIFIFIPSLALLTVLPLLGGIDQLHMGPARAWYKASHVFQEWFRIVGIPFLVGLGLLCIGNMPYLIRKMTIDRLKKMPAEKDEKQ